MPGRKYNSAEYRYGFNGKEKDDEGEFGSITNYDYGFRIYNPAIGKFLSVDPLTREYPFYTPYQFAGNMPIVAIDLDGLEQWIPGTVEWIIEKAKAELQVQTDKFVRKKVSELGNAVREVFNTVKEDVLTSKVSLVINLKAISNVAQNDIYLIVQINTDGEVGIQASSSLDAVASTGAVGPIHRNEWEAKGEATIAFSFSLNEELTIADELIPVQVGGVLKEIISTSESYDEIIGKIRNEIDENGELVISVEGTYAGNGGKAEMRVKDGGKEFKVRGYAGGVGQVFVSGDEEDRSMTIGGGVKSKSKDGIRVEGKVEAPLMTIKANARFNTKEKNNDED